VASYKVAPQTVEDTAEPSLGTAPSERSVRRTAVPCTLGEPAPGIEPRPHPYRGRVLPLAPHRRCDGRTRTSNPLLNREPRYRCATPQWAEMGSNHRHPAFQTGALPLSYLPVGDQGIEPCPHAPKARTLSNTLDPGRHSRCRTSDAPLSGALQDCLLHSAGRPARNRTED
jgi:hypothetical protein